MGQQALHRGAVGQFSVGRASLDVKAAQGLAPFVGQQLHGLRQVERAVTGIGGYAHHRMAAVGVLIGQAKAFAAKHQAESMGGRVEIDSMLGIGTRMTVRLPLTLAILDGMSVGVGDQIYILPLSYVIESLQPKAGDVKTLSNQARVVQVRGEYLPVVVLHEMFGLKSAWTDFTQGIMVVLDADGTKACLFVDALVGQHQVVIKSLEANYRRVNGISGATIMGDGHVALILDVSAIASMAKSITQKAA